MVCPNCGAKAADDVRFCPECGREMPHTGAEEAPPPAQPELPAADSPELPAADSPELPVADPPELPTAESSETEGDSPETAENGNFLTTVLGPLLVKVFRWLMENSANLAGQYRA